MRNPQAPNPKELPSSQASTTTTFDYILEFEVWSFPGDWGLGFGASAMPAVLGVWCFGVVIFPRHSASVTGTAY
jgi:hypothetical protein